MKLANLKLSAVFLSLIMAASMAASFAYAQNIKTGQIDRGAITDAAEEPDPCKSAEPKGMTRDFRECSADCKTVCSYKTTVDEVNCFACQQGGDETCKDIGLLDHPHPWCQPGGFCHSNPELYCTVPAPAVTPKRSKVTCTSCKKRPDMCWKFVRDGTTSLTNCRLGCWNGTCQYVGRYDKQEWDNSTEWLHCYECITPPPPPTCEDLKWGTDWESDCLRMCAAPGYCEEFEFEVGKKNPKACQPVDTDEKFGENEDDDKGGTRTRGGGGQGGGKKPDGPGSGINDPTKPYGSETASSVKPKTPCEEVADGLTNPNSITIEPPHSELERRQRWLKRFQTAVEKLKEKTKQVNDHLSGQREKIAQLESQLPQAQADLKEAKAAARGAENLGGYGKQKLKELKAAQTRVNQLSSELSQSRTGLKRQQASFNKDIGKLRTEAQRALYQADPSAKLTESLSRTDSYYEAYRDHERNRQMKEISDKKFAEKAAELQKKIDKGGSNAERYQTELDNLNRGKKEWDAVYDRRQRHLAQDINRMQKENGEIGAGPFDLKTLQEHIGMAVMEIQKQINKLEKLKDLMEKAAKNNCPPKGADKVAKELEKKLKDLDTMMGHIQDRYLEVEKGFPLSEEDKRQVAQSASRVANGSTKMGPVKDRWDFFAESLAEETVRTITDPGVAIKKAFWYSVGIVEGVGKAIKGLVELGVGTLDLAAETIESYLNSGDETLFGRDASEALQKFFQATDGNLNLDGIEKLAQSISTQLSKYEKKLIGTDMDKTVSRAGGNVAGELVVGDYIIGKTMQGASKLRTVLKGADAVGDGSKVLKGGSKVSGGTTKVDDLVTKADDLKAGSSGTRVGAADNTAGVGGKVDGRTGKGTSTVDDAAAAGRVDGTGRTPSEPPKKAPDIDNTKPLDRSGRAEQSLDRQTSKKLETENGFRQDHAENMHRFAQEHDAFLIVRDGNPDSVRHMNNPDFMPKPVTSKAKTAKVGPKSNQGLVVDPTHPTQAQYWDDAIAEAANAGDTKRLQWLKDNRRKAIKEWNNYGEKMQKNGYFVQDNGVIGYRDPTTGKVYKGIHGDYDLHGVYKAGPDGTATGKVSYGSGDPIRPGGSALEDGSALRKQLNEAIDPKKDYIQHGAQDDWVPDPKYVPNKPPDPPATVFFPDGRPPKRLETHAEMKKFYEEEMGVKFDYPDPPKKTGLSSGTGATNAPPTPASQTLPEFNGVKINSTPVQGAPKVSTHATSNSDLNFVDKSGSQVQLKTGKHLGSGSTSSVYVDAANPQQVIRVTNTVGDVKEAAKLDEFGRKVIEDVQQQTDSIRIVRQVDRKVVQNQPGSHLNNHVVEVVEKAENGTAKSMIAEQGGKLTEQQAQALNKAIKDLNDRGYAWLDAKPDNYGFEKIPGTDDIRVVVIDPGGIVPMKSPGAARKMQYRIQRPDAEFVEGYNSVGNPDVKDMFAADEWKNIIQDHGGDIDLNKLGVSSAQDVKFNPSGNVNQPRVGQLFLENL